MKCRVMEGVWVVVPAYFEASAIGTVVRDTLDAGYSIVVVDDGSTDATSTVALDAGAEVVVHPINLGQGAALQTGIDYALRRDARYIVTFDADGQHRVADIEALLAPLVDGRADFALGSRFLGQAVGAPKSRLILLRIAIAFTRLFSGLKLTDVHNGLRAMTRHGARRLRLRQNRMAHASEILNQIAESGLCYVEVPVTVHYSSYSLAKGQRMTNSINILLELFARSLWR
jgi:glycosyltransferase involved in cell wall biosynthesis